MTVILRHTLDNIEVAVQEIQRHRTRRLVLHIGFNLPKYLDSYKGIGLLRLRPNDQTTRWPPDRFPFILYWEGGHNTPCRTWKQGIKAFNNIKGRQISRIVQGVDS